MSELRDAIEAELQDAWVAADRTFDEEAAVVLATPELQAIRKALYLMAVKIAGEWGGEPEDSLREGEATDYSGFKRLGTWSLPPSVVAWVLDGET